MFQTTNQSSVLNRVLSKVLEKKWANPAIMKKTSLELLSFCPLDLDTLFNWVCSEPIPDLIILQYSEHFEPVMQVNHCKLM
jgi:hypothetical protein